MEIDLRDLEEGRNEFHWDEEPEDLHITDPELKFKGPIHSDLEVYKLGESLSASGETQFHLLQECVRCLKSFSIPLSASYKFVLQKGKPETLENDDETLIWVDGGGDTIDLGKEVRDYIQLEVPLTPLCKEDCPGLCPTCGADWNEEKCDCSAEVADPRWDALKSLKKELQGE